MLHSSIHFYAPCIWSIKNGLNLSLVSSLLSGRADSGSLHNKQNTAVDIRGHKGIKEMLFLTNELAKKAEITILPALDTTRPGSQAGALWVVNQGYIRGS